LVALQVIYPDYEWDPSRFHKATAGYWKDLDNQRQFFSKVAKELKIQTYEDWYKVSVSKFQEMGGGGILKENGHSLVKGKTRFYRKFYWRF
jgi:hypothetical protein